MTSLAVAASQVTSHRSFCARATYVVIALTMVLVLPVTSLAQQPGGRIARDSCYSIPGEYGYEVHCDVAVMDLGASGYSYTAGQGIDPALSPDGTHLAFASESSVQITVVNLQTGSRDVVFNETGEWVGSPGWSFDRRIAFTRYRYALLPELWVMNADGTGLRQIAAAGFRGGPSWSPDGRIAFLCEIETGNLDICTVHADVTSFTRLTNSERDEAFPAFAPDGARIAFTDVGLLSILNADGSVINLGVRGGPATWSPDGTMHGPAVHARRVALERRRLYRCLRVETWRWHGCHWKDTGAHVCHCG